MGTSRREAAGAASASHGTDRSQRAGRRWLLRASGDDDTAMTEQLGELEREVALLREENARLKLTRAQAGSRPVNERVRAAFASPQDDESPEEDPWEILTECMLLRETLLEACRELERGAGELRTRLETLTGDAEGAERASADLEGVT